MILNPISQIREVGFCVFILIKSELFLTLKATLRMDVLMIKKLCEIGHRGHYK
jgi:hypothetical protein